MTESNDDEGSALAELPAPQSIAASAVRFEGDLGRSLLPMVGFVAAAAGGLLLLNSAGQARAIGAGALTAVGAAAVALSASARLRESRLVLDGGFALLLVAVNTLPTWAHAVAAVALSAEFARRAAKGSLAASTAWLVLPFAPLGVTVLSHAAAPTRIALSLAPLAIVFAATLPRRRSVALAALTSSVGLVSIEVLRAEEKSAFLVACLVTLLVAIPLYERTVPVDQQSDARQVAGHALFASVALMLAFAAPIDAVSSEGLVRSWALLVASERGLRIVLKRRARPAQVIWIALPLAVALGWGTPGLPPEMSSLALLALVAASQLAALLLRSRSISNFAALLALFVGISGIVGLQESAGLLRAGCVGALAAAALILISHRPPLDVGLRWWVGFVRADHAAKLRQYAKGAVQVVLVPIRKIGLLAATVDGGRAVLRWLHYCRGARARPIGNDVIYAAGVALLCLTVSWTAFGLAVAHGASAKTAVVLGSAAWQAIGVLVVVVGLRNGWLLQRFLGAACILYPIVFSIPDVWSLLGSDREDSVETARTIVGALLLGTGFAFALLGVLRRTKLGRAPEPPLAAVTAVAGVATPTLTPTPPTPPAT